MASSSLNLGSRVKWIKYANNNCFCGRFAAIKVLMTFDNPNRLFYCCKEELEEMKCDLFRWCEPIGYENDTPQLLEAAVKRRNAISFAGAISCV